MKKYLLFVVFAMFMLVTAACGGSQPSGGSDATQGAAAETPAAEGEAPAEEPAEPAEITVTHQLGETVVPVNPEKVIVFDFGALDSLDRLGVEVAGVAKSGTLPPYLEKYGDSKYANIGSLKEPDFEKIAEIDPDLILISGRQSDFYEELSKLGPTVFIGVDNANYIESFEKNATILGQIFQKEAEVEAELKAVEEEISSLNAAASASGKNALIVLTNEGSISAYGPKSRFGIIHDVFGFKAVDENIEVSTHGMQVSFEYIVEKDPDILFVIDRGVVVTTGADSAPATGLLDNELIKNTKAYKNNSIIYLDPNYWYLSGGGLESVSGMVKQVAEETK